MLAPKRVQHRKVQRGSMKGNAKGGTQIAFGEWGLVALDRHWITNRQIEAARIAMTRKMKRGGRLWINIFPDKPITKKPAETRMGSGKGNPEEWVAVVKPGRVMFEITGVSEEVAREALRLASHKLPVRCKIVHHEGGPVAALTEHILEEERYEEMLYKEELAEEAAEKAAKGGKA